MYLFSGGVQEGTAQGSDDTYRFIQRSRTGHAIRMDAFMLGIGMLGKMIVAALDARTWVKLRKERDVQSKIVSH